MKKTIEEIMAAMTAVMDGAADRDLTDEECTRYEALEEDLRNAQRSDNLRARDQAYNVVRIPAGVPAPPRPTDGQTDLDRAFDNYLRTGKPNADLQPANAQSTGSSAGGGYTVPTTFAAKMIDAMKAFGGISQVAETMTTTTGEPIEWATLDDTDNQGAIAAEGAAPASGADLAFGKDSIGAYRYTSAGTGSNLPLRVSTRLLADSQFDIAGLVARKLGERIARKQAVHWATGTGVGEPLGLVADSITSDRDLDTADTPDYVDLLGLYDLLDEAYEANALWLLKKNTWTQLREIVDLNGRPILQDSTSGIGGAPAKALLNFPVQISQEMPTLSSAGITKPIVFGDIKRAYLIRYVGSPAVLVNPYNRMEYGQVEYTGEQWADGLVQERSAYVVMRNNT